MTLGRLRAQSKEKRVVWDCAGSASKEGESSLQRKRSMHPWRRQGRLSEGEEILEGELEGEGERLLALREDSHLQRILYLSLGMLAAELELELWRAEELTGGSVGGMLRKTVADMQETEREI